MKIRQRLVAIIGAGVLGLAARQGECVPAKNIILLIGDGMGFEHVAAARDYNGSPLAFEGLPYKGQVTTYSADSSVTDSAAAGTAMATGVKVNNEVISVALPGDGHELTTLLEYYGARGKSTGLVTTAYMTDATPAAFGAHDSSRNNTTAIAGDYLNQTRPELLLGGGGRGITSAAAQTAGYMVVTDRAEMQAAPTNAVTRLSGQFGTTNLPYEYDGVGTLPHLTEMTQTALSILGNDPDGMFLMVEGGLIDKAAHLNDLLREVPETVEFARTVAAVLAWAAGRNDTLILVTADHETGGLTVTGDNGPGEYPSVTWSTTGHTDANVPVYAWGFGAFQVSGTMDNTGFFEIATWSAKAGDANGDGRVDGADLATWQQNYSPAGTDRTFYQGDWDGNGKIDGADLALWQQNYSPAGYGAMGEVPEPGTLMLATSGLVAFWARTRRRKSGDTQ